MSIERKIAQILAESRGQVDEDLEDDELLDEDEDFEDEDDDLIEEENDDEEESASDGQNPDNARNNVDRQEIGGLPKTRNMNNANESDPEPMIGLGGVREDIEALTRGEELSEEFKEKATVIFETAVLNRVKQEVARLDEAYQEKLDEQIDDIKEGLIEKVDGYLDYIVEQWIEQNEIALERGMKSEILEGFVEGLRDLFAEHYIDAPEEKFDVVEALEEHASELSTMLDEQVAVNVELNKALAEYEKALIAEDLSKGLVATDKDKFLSLIEEVEFDGPETFTKKAQTIRESYFTKQGNSKSAVRSPITDTPVLTEENQYVDPEMRQYLSALDNLAPRG